MAGNLKYNLREKLLEADETHMGDDSLLGMTMLTQPTYINSMRSVMFTSHLKQFVNLLEPDFPGVFTNGENVVGKYSSGYKKVKHDTTVFRKINKFEDLVDKPLVSTVFVFDEKKKKYNVWTRKESEKLTEMFGYDYNNEVIDSLQEGDYVEAGTVVYKSKSYDEFNNYRYGKNVRMMYTLDPYTSEDACVISESLYHKMNSIEARKVDIGVNQNDVLLNLYGDAYEYKPFPDLGETATGEVAAKRTLFNEQLLTEFKDDSLARISESDTRYFCSGQVIDIDIFCNNPEIEENAFNSQILKYLRSQNKYYEEIKETCEEIMKSGFDYNSDINSLYKRACLFLDTDKRWKKDNSVFGNLLVTITLRNEIPLHIGQKITGRYGNKSVIAQVRPDSEMPHYYDEDGNMVTIDLLLNMEAIINRTTAMPIYEVAINFICDKVRAQMKKMTNRKAKEILLFDVMHELNEVQAKKMKEIYDKLSEAGKDEFIEQCITNRIYIHQKPMWETKPIFYRLLDIHNKYDFLQPYKMFINKWGREIPMLNPAYIGEMYIIKLKQTSRKGFSARGMESINSKGLPERSYKNKSYQERHSNTAIRFGEVENLNFAIGMESEDLQLLQLLYRTSLKGRKDLAANIMSPGDEFTIDSSYTSRVAEIFGVILKSLGLRLNFVDKDTEELREYDDHKLKKFTYKGSEYLCTEYQFKLVKRRRDIEDEILKKAAIIDKDRLNDLVMEEMMKRSYLIGPSKDEYNNTPGLQPDTVA